VVYICEGGSDSSRSTTGSDGRRTYIPKTSNDKSWLLNYWCFSAGVALRQLKNLGVRSLLLASGTLSPMGALKADFMLPFPVELENKHVIQDSQIWVAAVGKGPTGGQLNSTMKVRGLSTYKDELGSTIVNICLTMMGKGFSRTPPGPRVNGGVLIFFPTYFVMEDCVKRWKESALWHKLETAGGKVFIEPRASGDSANASTNASSTNTSKVQAKNSNSSSYPKKGVTKTAAATPTGGPASVDPKSAALFDNFISAFESAVKRDGNAVLLAVCQGKVSEGIDFTDEKGRAVIVTGIPYAPVGDAWVILKRRYLDERVHGLIRPSKSSSSSVTMKGELRALQKLSTAKES
jgi:regulator of telomere elongation helicase 1